MPNCSTQFAIDESGGRAAWITLKALEDGRLAGREYIGIIGPTYSSVAMATCHITPYYNAMSVRGGLSI